MQLLSGKQNSDIAKSLNMAEKTVAHQIARIGDKFGTEGGRVPILSIIIRALQEEIRLLRKQAEA